MEKKSSLVKDHSEDLEAGKKSFEQLLAENK